MERGGKDSALALYKVMQQGQLEVQTLLTTISEPYQRISMHGVRVALLDQQVASLGLPCHQLFLPETPTMETYEQHMANTLIELKSRGATAAIFGDIFLEDLRAYRENQLARQALHAVFPLWGASTRELVREFMGLVFKTITTCVHAKYLDRSFVGRIIDEDFLRDLPAHVDPCGENGEFHTFVFNTPFGLRRAKSFTVPTRRRALPRPRPRPLVATTASTGPTPTRPIRGFGVVIYFGQSPGAEAECSIRVNSWN